MQHGLAGDAKSPRRLLEADEAVGPVGHTSGSAGGAARMRARWRVAARGLRESQARAGAPVLLVEDAAIWRSGVMGGEAAGHRDRAVGGAPGARGPRRFSRTESSERAPPSQRSSTAASAAATLTVTKTSRGSGRSSSVRSRSLVVSGRRLSRGMPRATHGQVRGALRRRARRAVLLERGEQPLLALDRDARGARATSVLVEDGDRLASCPKPGRTGF